MEPLGVLLLAAIARRAGHDTGLAVLRSHGLVRAARRFRPDVIAYSTSSADLPIVQQADAELRNWIASEGLKIRRIMGGPHPTYCPDVIDELKLDAICQGDGDHALPELLDRWSRGGAIDDIPNIAVTRHGAARRALTHDLDALPYADRALYYETLPYYHASGLRSFITGRGCPYACSYCFNHAFNDMFRECGTIMRRRSVENVLTEVEEVMRRYPPMRFVRFADDTFAHKADDWLREFCEEYPRRIGVPFYCFMRSNTLNDETASLLSGAGCRAIAMSIESGVESIRNEILHRSLTDEQVGESFRVAHAHGLATYASTMLGVPGSRLADDFTSLEFVRKTAPTGPIFTICSPYRGTRIWRMSVERGFMDPSDVETARVGEASTLNCFTPREKAIQARLCYLGPLYCRGPRLFAPLVRALMHAPIPPALIRPFGLAYTAYRLATRVMPWAIPRNPRVWLRIAWDSLKYML
jgi:radical SAM superfamily enzyme YgiQ (UPF0313 family)